MFNLLQSSQELFWFKKDVSEGKHYHPFLKNLTNKVKKINLCLPKTKHHYICPLITNNS